MVEKYFYCFPSLNSDSEALWYISVFDIVVDETLKIVSSTYSVNVADQTWLVLNDVLILCAIIGGIPGLVHIFMNLFIYAKLYIYGVKIAWGYVQLIYTLYDKSLCNP